MSDILGMDFRQVTISLGSRTGHEAMTTESSFTSRATGILAQEIW